MCEAAKLSAIRRRVSYDRFWPIADLDEASRDSRAQAHGASMITPSEIRYAW